MKNIGAYAAKTHLSSLLDDVARGQELCITKKGVPVALLVPVGGRNKADVTATIAALREMRRKTRLKPLNLKDLVSAGRKY